MTTNTLQLKHRHFKRTEIGPIPSGWRVARLSEFGSFAKGSGIRKDQTSSDGVPCIRYGEIYTHHNDHIRKFNSFIPRTVAKQARRLKKGDLLFAGSGETAEEIGKCVAYLGQDEAYAGGDIIVFTPVGQDSLFLGYLMNHPLIANQKARAGQGDAVVHIRTHHLAQVQVPLPPIPEQSAIASALSDVDSLIESLDRLIAKKRAIKQGAMQELLTGNRRLPGFAANWETYSMGDVVNIRTGKKDVNEGDPRGQYPFFTCSREVSRSDSYSFDGEAVLIAGNGEVGNLHYYNGRFEAYQRTYVLQNFAINARYLWYQLSAYLKGSLGMGTIGTSIPYIKRENLTSFNFRAPRSPEEQTAIADTLRDLDREIEATEKQLSKMQNVKLAMMQSLLTGKVRLPT